MDSAYDPTINRAEEQPPKQGDTMSIPAADKGAAAQQEGEGAGQQGADPTLEEEVKQLVGSVTSWWSGFSKKVRLFPLESWRFMRADEEGEWFTVCGADQHGTGADREAGWAGVVCAKRGG